MKISPLEIRQKTFEKAFRGFDKDEVLAYLTSLSHEWEKIIDENKEMGIKLDFAGKEISKLREVEGSLYKTLKTAEDTGANVIEQANKAAELQMKESRMKAEKMINDADMLSKSMVSKAEKEARDLLNRMLDDVKVLEQNFNMITNIKENLISELKNLSNDALDRVKKFSKRNDDMNIKKYIKQAREVASYHHLNESISFDDERARSKPQNISNPAKTNEAEKQGSQQESVDNKKASRKAKDGEGEKSFFDTIG